MSNPATVAHRSGLALALLRRGDRRRAASLAEEELELSRRWGAPRALGISLRTLGLCRHGAEGEVLLRESVWRSTGSGAELEHARSLVELGSAIRRAGRRSEARDPLHAGMELAHRCGATPLVRAGARGAPRAPAPARAGSCEAASTRSRRASCASPGWPPTGSTNREIAQALFVTQRTVETHLTHVFQKLDIASRGELEERLTAAAPDPLGARTKSQGALHDAKRTARHDACAMQSMSSRPAG